MLVFFFHSFGFEFDYLASPTLYPLAQTNWSTKPSKNLTDYF